MRVENPGGRFRGTGAFVAPRTVLTCAHVVHDGEVRVAWQGITAGADVSFAAPPLSTVADPAHYPLPDLALLSIEEHPQLEGHPCVLLGVEVPALDVDDPLYLAGYTVEHSEGRATPTGATVDFESPITEDGVTFHKLKNGQVAAGFSGAPLLRRRTKAVCAVVESTRDRRADLGGFAVPVAALGETASTVMAANEAFHAADRRWREAARQEDEQAARRRGLRARLPLQPPVVELDWDEDRSPAEAMRARHVVVPYVGRERLLGDLAMWCEDDDPDRSVALWFVTGGGGFGKTRLAVEACVDAERRGWTAGLLPHDVDDDDLDALADWPGRLLVAIDYAETRAAIVGRLVAKALARSPRAPVRILLLVRQRASRPQLVAQFNEHREEQLTRLLRAATISVLDDDTDEVDRLELFDRAVEAFARVLGRPPGPSSRRPRLRAAHFARPLYVLVAAFLVATDHDVDVEALDERDLLRHLIDEHEANYWARWADRSGLELEREDQRVAVALATMLTAADEAEALTVVDLLPHFEDESASRRLAIARWLARLYRSELERGTLRIGALEPDRLGEVLVADVLRERPELLERAVDRASDAQLARLLTVIARAARDDDHAAERLRDVLDEQLSELLRKGLHGGPTLLVAVLTAMHVSGPMRGALDAAYRFPHAVPVWFRPIVAAITGLAAHGVREQVELGEATVQELAVILEQLGGRLADTGDLDGALAVAEEVVDLYRELAASEPTFTPDLARSLSNWSMLLDAAGRRSDALAMAQEAVALFGDPAEIEPDILPSFAAALGNLATSFTHLGRHDEALQAMEASVERYRAVVAVDEDEPRHVLAGALNNLAAMRNSVGRGDAVAAAEEAVRLYTEFVEEGDDAFAPELAGALNNLANALSHAGRRDEAVAAAEGAVVRYATLAEQNEQLFRPDLAMALVTLTACLRQVGRLHEAAATAEAAVRHYADLAVIKPDTVLSELARSLLNLAAVWGDLGRHEEALSAAQEAVARFAELAEANPQAFRPALGMAINNLSTHLRESGRPDEALDAAQDAVELWRRLTGSDVDRFAPELASALVNLAVVLTELDRNEEALHAAQEAVAHTRALHSRNSLAFQPMLAAAVDTMGMCLSHLERHEEALRAVQEAVGHYQALVERNPEAFLGELAASQNNLANALSEIGRHEEALIAAERALDQYRLLVRGAPSAYAGHLARVLTNLLHCLAEVGRHDRVEPLFDELLAELSDVPHALAHIAFVRAGAHLNEGRVEDAVADFGVALDGFERAHDMQERSTVRTTLRMLRRRDSTAFDAAWEATGRPLPVWLQYDHTDQALVASVLDWINTPDWVASREFLREHADVLLGEKVEATVEQLVDLLPQHEDTLREHLALLHLARSSSIDSAYDHRETNQQLERAADVLSAWLRSPTPELSRAFVSEWQDELLDGPAQAVIERLYAQDPRDHDLRVHCGLLALFASDGIDTAYDLHGDGRSRREALERSDEDSSDVRRLALARLDSGLEADDAEAHFRLAVAAARLGDPFREAAVAIDECVDHAAPYERADFSRRLRRLAAEEPELAPALHELDARLHGVDGGHDS
ncbi:MAG TPA: tetratricopeptide repeat protein [Acidimicrobiales bacterium]|nr:tetratricopeptide repeat protein [Acidimicrobiales bacterium]